MRPVLALYIGGMGSRKQNFYNNLVQRYGFEDAAAEIQNLYLDGKKEEAGHAIPDELIDSICLCGPRDFVRERIQAFRDAGVGTLMVSPMAFTADERIDQLRAVAELAVEHQRGRLGGRHRGRRSRRVGGGYRARDSRRLGGPAAALLPGRVRAAGPRVSDARPGCRARRPRPRRHLRDLDSLAGAGGGARDEVHRRARVPRLPHPRTSHPALCGDGPRGEGHSSGDRRLRAGRGRPRHPHPALRRWPPSSRAFPRRR